MTRATTLTMATMMSVAALAVAGQTASAAAAPTEAPSPATAIPADFVTLTDDTGTITVGVPSSWADVETWPTADGPTIVASTDIDGFIDTFDVPGVIYSAWNFADATEMTSEGVSVVTGGRRECTDEQVLAYDDGVFVGTERVFTGCGSSGVGEYHVIVAKAPDQSFNAVLRIKLTGPEQLPTLDGIRATFDSASGVEAVAPSAPSTTVASAAPTDAFAPSGAIPDGWTALVDDTQTLSLAVPAAWTGTIVAPLQLDNGSSQPTIAASADPDRFFGGDLSVPGVRYGALPRDDVTAGLLDPSLWPECTLGAVQPYDDGAFVGYIGSFEGCGGTATRMVDVIANPAEGVDFTAYVSIQLTGAPDDAATLDGLLSSFNWVSDPAAPTATLPQASTPTIAGATGLGSIDEVRQMVADEFGLTVTDAQGQCIVDNSAGVDPTFADGAELLLVVLDCGVNPIPGG
jgi:hypothetical protein